VLSLTQALANSGPIQRTDAGELPDISLRVVSRLHDRDRWIGDRTTVTDIVPNNRALRLAWEQTRLPRTLLNEYSKHPFIWHSPHYTFPWKVRGRIPTIVTIHDMTFFDYPQFHERKKVAFFQRSIERAVTGADELVAVSEHTAHRIAARFPQHRPITVIPHGIDHSRFNETRTVADEEIVAQLGNEPFALFVGTLEPRKQVDLLIQAFDQIADRHPDLRLVLAGRDGWGMDAIQAALTAARHKERIVRLGYVKETILPALYRAARVTVYPSTVEGFGLPALEAMACGSPLIIASGTPMDDFASPAALRIRPTLGSLTEALDASVSDTDLRRAQREQGPRTASAFTWKRTATAHQRLYTELAQRRGVRTSLA